MQDILARVGGEGVAAAAIERLAGVGQSGAAVDAEAHGWGLAPTVGAGHTLYSPHSSLEQPQPSWSAARFLGTSATWSSTLRIGCTDGGWRDWLIDVCG